MSDDTKDWREVEELKGSKLESLVNDLKEQEAVLDDAANRVGKIRTIIAETIEGVGHPVKIGDKVARWYPETKTFKLDKQSLIKAGVTPDQIAKGTVEGKKKGYFEIRGVKDDA